MSMQLSSLSRLLALFQRGGWRNKITPQSVFCSLMAFSAKYGIHVMFADNRDIAAQTVEGLLFQFLRRQYDHLEQIKL